jgi:hypothetical protein
MTTGATREQNLYWLSHLFCMGLSGPEKDKAILPLFDWTRELVELKPYKTDDSTSFTSVSLCLMGISIRLLMRALIKTRGTDKIYHFSTAETKLPT